VWHHEVRHGGRREERREERHEEWRHECHRCARLELVVVTLQAERAAARAAGERVVVACRDDEPADGAPGSRLAALVLALFASFRDHPWVWTFITLVAGPVLVITIYGTVRFLTGG
jgi:hypothetical protein